MRKSILFLLVLLTIPFLQSCLDDPERHQLNVVYPNNTLLFADATVDSLQFYTFDSWEVHPNCSWIDVNGDNKYNFPYDYEKLYLCTVLLSLQPNTTGKTRMGTVTVNSYDYSASGLYTQLGFLRITNLESTVKEYVTSPYDGVSVSIPLSVDFYMADSAFVTQDSICFTVEKSWTLGTPDGSPLPSWFQLEKTSGRAGHNNVAVTLEENPYYEDRKTTVRLSSSGVNTDISITQFARKKKSDEEEEGK